MTRCPHPHCGGQILDDSGRLVCILCGFVAAEPEPSTLEKMVSNATPENAPELGGKRERPAMPLPDLKAMTARVMAKIRAEAANG